MKTVYWGTQGGRCVWIKKGERFPGCWNIPQKQGYYLLWQSETGAGGAVSEYLGLIKPEPEYLSLRLDA